MYETYWDKEKKKPRSKNMESFGYLSELISDEIPDPISFYTEYVKRKNNERAASVAADTRPRAFTTQLEKNIGFFLVSSLLSELNVKETIDILASRKRFQFHLYDMITQLIYARILYPCSKSKTVSTVFPHLYNGVSISEIKCFKNEINSYDLVTFMRDFRVVDKGDGTYINISQNQTVNEKIKKLIGLTNLDALYLTEKEIENIFEYTMLIDS